VATILIVYDSHDAAIGLIYYPSALQPPLHRERPIWWSVRSSECKSAALALPCIELRCLAPAVSKLLYLQQPETVISP
jgi:hypothetical protein